MLYEVDKKKRNAVIKDIKKKRSDKVAVSYLVWNIGIVVCLIIIFIPSVIGIAMSVNFFMTGDSASAYTSWIFILLGLIAAAVVYIIPAAFRSIAIRKYLMAWIPKIKERVLMTDKAIEHGFYNKFYGEHYYTFKIQYHDVVRIEFDEMQNLLRVYGPKEERWWTDIDKNYCVDKTTPNYQDKEGTWLEIPTYFDDFDGLKRELEERTGKQIENTVRPFMLYGRARDAI